MTTIIFTVDNLRFAPKSYDILTLADCLTVLQTYWQAFSFPQLSLNWLVFTGFFSLKLNTGFFTLKLSRVHNLRAKNPVFKLRAKIPAFKSINYKSFWHRRGLNSNPFGKKHLFVPIPTELLEQTRNETFFQIFERERKREREREGTTQMVFLEITL